MLWIWNTVTVSRRTARVLRGRNNGHACLDLNVTGRACCRNKHGCFSGCSSELRLPDNNNLASSSLNLLCEVFLTTPRAVYSTPLESKVLHCSFVLALSTWLRRELDHIQSTLNIHYDGHAATSTQPGTTALHYISASTNCTRCQISF